MKKRIALLMIAVALGSTAATAATTLRVSHMYPAESAISKEVFGVWAQKIEEASGGEITLQMFPSGTLSKSDQAYQAAVNGISDIAVTAQAYTAGRFPLTQIVELPGMVNTAQEGSCILQSLYDAGHLDSEYADTKVLFLYTRGPGIIHLKDKEVASAKDLAGLRIRRPSAVVGQILENFGAQPMGLPMPDVYTSMQRGVMDGAITSYQGAMTFGLNDVVTAHAEVPLETLAFVATMNKRSFERLSPTAQKALMDNSGMTYSSIAAKVYDRLDKAGKADAIAKGHAIHVVENPLEHPEWSVQLKSGIDSYLAELEKRGLPSRAVYDAALAARADCVAMASR